MLLNKVVVFFPLAGSVAGTQTYGSKTYETRTEEEYLELNNTDAGYLVILCRADLQKYVPITLAVFKEWIYWERLEKKPKA